MSGNGRSRSSSGNAGDGRASPGIWPVFRAGGIVGPGPGTDVRPGACDLDVDAGQRARGGRAARRPAGTAPSSGRVRAADRAAESAEADRRPTIPSGAAHALSVASARKPGHCTGNRRSSNRPDARRHRRFLAYQIRPTMRYRRHIQALRTAPPRIVIAVGTASKGQLANRTEVALAGQLGTSVVEFPGDARRIRGRVLDRVLTETP